MRGIKKKGTKTIGVCNCTLYSLIVVFTLLIKRSRVIFIYWEINKFNEIAIFVLKKIWNKKFRIQPLPAAPGYLSAKMLSNLEGNNLRCDVNEQVILTAKALVDKYFGNDKDIVRLAGKEYDPNTIIGLLRRKISMDIEPHFYLAYHLYSQRLIKSNGTNYQFLIIIPKSWYARDLINPLETLKIGVLIGGSTANTFVKRSVCYCLRKISRFSVFKEKKVIEKQNKTEIPKQFVDPYVNSEENDILTEVRKHNKSEHINGQFRVCSVISDGFDPHLRNNIRWFWDSGLGFSELVLVWENSYRKPSQWEQIIYKNQQILVYNVPTDHAIYPDYKFKNWQYSKEYKSILKKLIIRLLRMIPKTLFPFGARQRWMLFFMLPFTRQIARWQDFFICNRIKIFVEDSFESQLFARKLALEAVKGIQVLVHRSQEYDNHNYLSERFGDINLLSGIHGIRQLVDKSENSPLIAFVGYPDDQGSEALTQKMSINLKKTINNNLQTVVVFDEGGFIYGADKVYEFYDILLDDLKKRGGYQLIIKPKKRNILARFPENLRVKFDEMLEKRDCILLEPLCTASLAVNLADLVISLPSTTMFESIIWGVRTVVVNPYRTIRRSFNEHRLLQQCIFEDVRPLLESMHMYFRGNNPSFGDCSVMQAVLDFKMDRKGNERSGYFICSLLSAFNKGVDREKALRDATSEYIEKWGNKTVGYWKDLWSYWSEGNPEVMLNPPRFDREDDSRINKGSHSV